MPIIHLLDTDNGAVDPPEYSVQLLLPLLHQVNSSGNSGIVTCLICCNRLVIGGDDFLKRRVIRPHGVFIREGGFYAKRYILFRTGIIIILRHADIRRCLEDIFDRQCARITAAKQVAAFTTGIQLNLERLHEVNHLLLEIERGTSHTAPGDHEIFHIIGNIHDLVNGIIARLQARNIYIIRLNELIQLALAGFQRGKALHLSI